MAELARRSFARTRADLVHRFAVTSFLVLVVVGLVFGMLARALVRDHELELATTRAVGLAETGTAAALALRITPGNFEPSDVERLLPLVGSAYDRFGVANLVVWDETGTVLLASDPARIGTQPARGRSIVSEALRAPGPVTEFVEVGDGDLRGAAGTRLLDTRTVAEVNGETVVIEVSQPYGPIEDRIRRWQLAAFSLPVGALIGLWALLMPLLRGARFRLEQLHDEVVARLAREQATVARLEELDRTKSAILTAVSHELRTPLTVVRGMLSTLDANGARLRDEQRTELIQRANANAVRLQELLTDLLDVDRLSRGTIEASRRPVDVVPVAARVAEQMDRGTHPIHLPCEGVIAHADPSLLERIIENLLANAVKYTPEGTAVWVRAARERDGATLVVEDAGPGIPAERQAAVFEPFTRLDADHPSPGAGIGLTLVAELVRLHGGSVEVGDRPGGGARFELWLPDDAQSAGPSPSRPTTLAGASA